MMRFLSLLLAVSLAVPIFADDDTALTVDGVKISKDEYIKLLERTTVSLPGGQQAKAERLVLDQIVSNLIILREAKKLGVLPSDAEVERLYNVQKKLMEANQPGKSYEQELANQGMTADELKADLKVQMAETNLYARKLNLSENEVKNDYQSNRENIGLPARTQLRLIMLKPNTPEVKQVIQQFKAGKSFEAVAKTTNDPSLRATGDEQVLYDSQFPGNVLLKVKISKEGGIIGPLKWEIEDESGKPSTLTAWIKVIKKLDAFTLEYADAAPILRRDLVRQQIQKPQNAAKRNEILKLKMKAKFVSDDPVRGIVWEDIKKVAGNMGIGK